MNNILLTRIPPPTTRVAADTLVQWGAYSGTGQLTDDVHISQLGELRRDWLRLQGFEAEPDDPQAEELLPDQVIVLLPGSLAIHRQIAISAGQRKHLHTALPFMIEEELAEDIDSMHLASYLARKKDAVSLSALTHEQMQQILACFDAQGLSPNQMISELQLAEVLPQSISLILENQSVILASPDNAVVNLDYEALHLVLKQWHQGEADSFESLDEPSFEQNLASAKLIFADGSLPTSTEQYEKVRDWLDEQGWLLEEQPLPGSVFEYFSDRYFELRRTGQLVDLRQGPYQCPKRTSRRIKRWKPLALVATLWLLVELGLTVGEALMYQKKAADYWSQSVELYLEAFPKDQQVLEARNSGQRAINLRSRMESRLKGRGGTSGGEPFLPLLQQVSAVSSSLGEVTFQPLSMDFNDTSGRLVLDLKAENLESIDKLRAAIKSSGLSVRLDSANQEKTGVNARMTIGR
ncbi:MAG: type II secretion system protein GspL [Endozoicomonas sp.]